MAVQSPHSLRVLTQQALNLCSVGGVLVLTCCVLPAYLGVSCADDLALC
jgi:hypothetical protein